MDRSDAKAINNHIIGAVIADAIIAAIKYLLQMVEHWGASVGVLHVITAASIWVLLLVAAVVGAASVALTNLITKGSTAQSAQITNGTGQVTAPRDSLFQRVQNWFGSKPLRVEIARFERLANGDPQYYTSRITIHDVVKNGSTFVALLVLEAGQRASGIAKNWSFTARTVDGVTFPAKIVDYGFTQPPDWPRDLERFSVVDGIRIAKGSLHRVYVHLGIKPEGIDETWLSASFEDDGGVKRTVVFDPGAI